MHETWVAAGAAMAALLAASPALANRNGIPGRAQIGCVGGGCHTGGEAPTVELSGPAELAPGESAEYMLMVAGPQPGAANPGAGANIEASAGTLEPASDEVFKVQLNQLVHQEPVPFDGEEMVHLLFEFTAPEEPGTVTLFAAANSVNGDLQVTGDLSALTSMQIEVAEGGGEGGADGAGGEPAAGGSGGGDEPDAGPGDGDGGGGGGGGGCQQLPGRGGPALLGVLALSALGGVFGRRLRRRSLGG